MTTFLNNIRSFSHSLHICRFIFFLSLILPFTTCLCLVHSRTVLLYLSWTCRSNFFNFSTRTNFHKIKAFAKPTQQYVAYRIQELNTEQITKSSLLHCMCSVGRQALRVCVAFVLSILWYKSRFIVEWEFVLHSHSIYVQFVVNHFGRAGSSNSSDSNSHRQRCWLKMTT